MAPAAPKPAAPSLPEAHPGAGAVLSPVSSWDPEKVGSSTKERDDYVATMQRDINCLSDADRTTRRTALQRLVVRLLKGDAMAPKPSPALLQAVLLGPLLAPVVRLLSDPVEKCREVALELLLAAASQVPDVPALLPSLVPALVLRMGLLPVAEPTEEVRLSIARLLEGPLIRRSGAAISSFAGDVSKVLCRGLEDPFPEIKKASCQGVMELVVVADPAALEPHTEPLCRALLVAASHQHSRVRQAALGALGQLVRSTGCTQDLLEGALVPGLKPLVGDPIPLVRTAASQCIALWLGAGQGARYDPDLWTAPLLPLLLLGLTDEAESAAEETLRMLEGTGAAWAGRQQQRGGDGAGATGRTGSEEESQDELQAAQLPRPFSGAPPAAARAMVRALLAQLLPPLLRELREWTVALRAASARVLSSTIILAGRGLTPHLDSLIPALCTAMGDDDPTVAQLALQAVHVLGALLPAKDWLPLATDCACSGRPLPPAVSCARCPLKAARIGDLTPPLLCFAASKRPGGPLGPAASVLPGGAPCPWGLGGCLCLRPLLR